MKRLTIFISLFFLSTSILAQNQLALEDSFSYFEGFQRTCEKYPDSAVHYMQKLAKVNTLLAEELLHNSFAQSFLNLEKEKIISDTAFLSRIKHMNITIDSIFATITKNKKIAYIILDHLEKDTSLFMKKNVYPIKKWVEVQDNIKNPTKLLGIGKNYLAYLTGSNDLYSQRKARYGLLISKLMTGNDELKSTSNKLSKLIYLNLQNNQNDADPQTLSKLAKEKRAWYRYMFAYTNFVFSQNTQNKDEKLSFLKLANLFSPDLIDKTVSHAYFYDMTFLFRKEKKSFEDDYLAALSNDAERFKNIMAMSMNEPSFKVKAKELYKDKANFNTVWLSEFNNNFKTAPLFSLVQLDGIRYNLGAQKHKWTFIDFWGTWCSPCRKEHPDLQKLYLKTLNGQLPTLNIVTIASKDSEPVVRAYMKEFKYSFPVAMSDNQIEKAYNISSWPSKFLISPQGKLVIIPFNVNWIKYIQDYITE